MGCGSPAIRTFTAAMHFISSAFWVFLPTVLLLYWLMRGRWRLQNGLLFLASCVFYGWWDARFLALIGASILVDYFVGLRLDSEEGEGRRKAWLGVSLVFNLGMLFWFKYAGFFVDQWVTMWGAAGVRMDPLTWNIILPVGISFYTFQTLSYSVDVYRRRIAPCRDFLAFATYVAFFPQLVAGPIERATRLLPQMMRNRHLTGAAARLGWRLICWGVFKKVVIADSAAMYANAAFGSAEAIGPVMALGVVAFAIQIYGDFSGYSDIAIGTARMFGIRLRSNFRFPYFSRDLGEFWRRWHVSLNTWFRDYLYIPLGGSRRGRGQALRNVIVVFLVSGLWHGADWKFVTWGAIHAACFVPLFLLGRNRRPERAWKWSQAPMVLWTFTMVCLAWVFFRADDFAHACDILGRLPRGWSMEAFRPAWKAHMDFWAWCPEGMEKWPIEIHEGRVFYLALLGFGLAEWVQFRHGIRWMWRGIWRGVWPEALMLTMALVYGTRHAAQEFIYFAF